MGAAGARIGGRAGNGVSVISTTVAGRRSCVQRLSCVDTLSAEVDLTCVPHRPPGRPRGGITLLELLVALVLVSLTAALVAPALPRPGAEDAQASAWRTVDAARATAVRRGETLALDVAADGRWSLVVAHTDSLPLAGGTLPVNPMGRRRLLVTPLGLCLPDDDADDATAWDAAACRPAGAPIPGGG